MKAVKPSDLRTRTPDELTEQLEALGKEIFNLRLQQASSQLEKPARLKTLRRDVARLETRISQLRNKAA